MLGKTMYFFIIIKAVECFLPDICLSNRHQHACVPHVYVCIQWRCTCIQRQLFHCPYAIRLLPAKQLFCSSLIKEPLYTNGICWFSFEKKIADITSAHFYVEKLMFFLPLFSCYLLPFVFTFQTAAFTPAPTSLTSRSVPLVSYSLTPFIYQTNFIFPFKDIISSGYLHLFCILHP